MSNIVVKEYLDNKVEFKLIDGEVYANATSFNQPQKLADWKRSNKTKELVDELNDMENSHIELIISERGGTNGGGYTWIHETLVLDLAQYISVKFRVWCQQQIATLIREGSVILKPKTEEEMLLSLFPSASAELISLTATSIRDTKRLTLENKTKQEIIERKTEIIDNMTEDLDEVRIRKIVTDYISRHVKSEGIEYSEAYNSLYSFFGRAIKTDIDYQFKKYIKNQNEIVKENKQYNRENNLKGIDRKMPCVKPKVNKISFIVNILNKGGDLIECMAKFFEVPVEVILEKYKSMEKNLIGDDLD